MRVAFVFICWFVFWISVGALFGGLSGFITAGPGGAHGGVGTGAFFWGMCGAVFAVITCYACEWILPDTINNWRKR